MPTLDLSAITALMQQQQTLLGRHAKHADRELALRGSALRKSTKQNRRNTRLLKRQIKLSKPGPDPGAAPTMSATEVLQAQMQARQDAASRPGMRSTLLAGETGGYKPMRQTLLG